MLSLRRKRRGKRRRPGRTKRRRRKMSEPTKSKEQEYTITMKPVEFSISEEEMAELEDDAEYRKKLSEPIFVNGNVYFCTGKFIEESVRRRRDFLDILSGKAPLPKFKL